MGKHAAAKSDKSVKTGAKMRREFSAGFVLFRQTPSGPLFLLLDYGKHWDYPKGHLEPGETAWRAAVRELREETGIVHVDRIGRFQRNMHYIFHSKKKGLVSKTVTYFLGQTRTTTIDISDEHEGFAWLPYDEALARLTFDTARQILTVAWKTMI
jgi:8-oxo-dGTP pyrophosphatase MutT (NUDIX family)